MLYRTPQPPSNKETNVSSSTDSPQVLHPPLLSEPKKNNLRKRQGYRQTLRQFQTTKTPSNQNGIIIRALGCRAYRGSASARAGGSLRPLQPGASPPAGPRVPGASLAPSTIWQSLRRGSPRSVSRCVQNLSRPGVTGGTKTISDPRALGPGPDGDGGSDQGRAPLRAPLRSPPLSLADGRAGARR